MQFKPYESGIEVSGASVAATIDAFKLVPWVAKKYLEKFGLLTPDRPFDRSAWYPQAAWLACHGALAKEVGANAMFQVGKTILDNVALPPTAQDIYSAMLSLDVGYHLNHRKNRHVMFDAATGKMLEGIGHYLSQPVEGEIRILLVASTPYDCDFDRGLIYGLAVRFEPRVRVDHDESKPCRKRGADSCTYVVSW